MLVTARVLKGDLPDETKYFTFRMRNHPCAYWVRNDRRGFLYATSLLSSLCAEYTYRFGKIHATEIFYFSQLPSPDLKELFPYRRREKKVPMAVGKHPLDGDPVRTYQEYYHTKTWKLKWTKRPIPPWYTPRSSTPQDLVSTEDKEQSPLEEKKD